MDRSSNGYKARQDSCIDARSIPRSLACSLFKSNPEKTIASLVSGFRSDTQDQMNRVSSFHAWACDNGFKSACQSKKRTRRAVHHSPESPAVLIAKSMFLANQGCRVSVLDQGFNTKKTSLNKLFYTESAKKAKRGRFGIAGHPPF